MKIDREIESVRHCIYLLYARVHLREWEAKSVIVYSSLNPSLGNLSLQIALQNIPYLLKSLFQF